MSEDTVPVFPVKFPAPEPKPRVNGDSAKPSEDMRPRPRRIIVDPKDWGQGATD